MGHSTQELQEKWVICILAAPNGKESEWNRWGIKICVCFDILYKMKMQESTSFCPISFCNSLKIFQNNFFFYF